MTDSSTSTMVRAAVRQDGRVVDDDATRTVRPASPDAATRTARPPSPAHAPTELAASESSPAPLKVRDRERYEIRGEQGRGGLGLVSRAHDRELGRDVAVKELLPGGNSSEQRFFREALITSRLEHPGIVPVHEAGRWPDGTPFYTMKLVGGRSLHARISELRTLEERLALLPNVIAVADAIAYAHERGVIHRDLKPSNVMVGDFGETIVIDWGLAKVLDDSADETDDGPYRSPARDELTVAGSVLGTPAYMAPEQYEGQSDKRTDIYTLGGILHHLLTGGAPHARSGSLGFIDPVLRYARNTPADLVAITKRALARDPAKRYQTASAFADDLKRYLRRERVVARRYSIFSRLSLAFARHRTVALVLMAALVALTLTLTVALVNIREERAQALTAQRQALINNATALLDHDPTRAWEVLRSIPTSLSPPLLRARIRGSGIADFRRKLPGVYESKRLVPAGDRIVFATSTRTLEELNLRSGELVRITSGLTKTPVWDTTDDRVYFVQGTAPFTIASTPIGGGSIVKVATLDTMPIDIQASGSGVFWQSSTGTLYQAAVDHGVRVLADNITAFIVMSDQVVVCTDAHRLEIGTIGEARTTVGYCDLKHPWGVGPRSFVHIFDDTIYVFTNGRLRTVQSAGATEIKVVSPSETGVVAGISVTGDGLLLRASATDLERIELPERALYVAAFGRLAGWALADGTIEVIDTVDGRRWSIHAIPGRPACFAILARSRVVICDYNYDEVRSWTLPETAPSMTVTAPSIANFGATNASGDLLLNGQRGQGYLIRRSERTVRTLHSHNAVSYGAAWCDGQACTSGFDGRVLCTDVASGTTHDAVAVHAISWLAVGDEHCFTAASSGGTYDLRSPERPLYTHQHEPTRVAVSPDGAYVASGDWGGELVTYDVKRARVIARLTRAHEGRVTRLQWLGDQLVSAGEDGVLALWSRSLVAQRSWHLESEIIALDTAAGTIAAADSDGVWILSLSRTDPIHVVVGALSSTLDVSPSGRHVTVATLNGEVVVISSDGRVAAVRLDHKAIDCLLFESDTAITACALHSLIRVPLGALAFER